MASYFFVLIVNCISFLTIIQETTGQNCVRSHVFSNVKERFVLKSENFPGFYYNNLNCQYTFTAPRGTRMTLTCPVFNVEASPSRQECLDWFWWSLNGDPNFQDSTTRYTCGTQFTSVTSRGRSLTIAFVSNSYHSTTQTPYRYQCYVDVVSEPCECGGTVYQENRIIGGVEARKEEIPWRVALISTIGSRHVLFCSGTLISPEWVLTAAHCVHGMARNGSEVLADIGDHNVALGDSKNKVIGVDNIIEHAWYNTDTQENDVALLHLTQPVNYDTNIQPVCLPWKFTSRSFDGDKAKVSGWGTTGFGGTARSDALRKTELNVIGSAKCRQFYESQKVEIKNNMLCTWAQGKDTCQGDSGGSLDYFDEDSERTYVIGVVSFGFGCATYNPGVYAQLINYLGWIEQNTQAWFCKA